MNYPSWAPPSLVELHTISRTRPSWLANGPALVGSEYEGMSIEQLENVRKRISLLYKVYMRLPWNEGTPLLGKLITDFRMKNAWIAINKRVKDEKDFLSFWRICQEGIRGWQRDQKLTKIQHKEFFAEVHEHATALSNMLGKAREFESYSIHRLVTPQRLSRFVQGLESAGLVGEDSRRSFKAVRAWSHLLDPSIHTVLRDISEKASRFAEQEPLVLKPNSDNASLHYFIRIISSYLSKKYNQPLHEVVATTAGVVFANENIDSNYVRSLLKTDP